VVQLLNWINYRENRLILVNSRLIAKGEVVVIDENFGVRITDVLSQAERLNNLR